MFPKMHEKPGIICETKIYIYALKDVKNNRKGKLNKQYCGF